MSSEEAGAQDYSVFGLRVRSEIPLPELFPATGIGKPDVTIRLGPVRDLPEAPPGDHVVDGGLLFVLPHAGRFLALGGKEVVAEPIPGIPQRNVRLYLLGSVFGAVLHQRELLPLHANAVRIGDSAMAFMGETGSGKSTLAAWFHDRGFQIVADDICVVKFDPHGPAKALPGLPRLRLWQEALEATGREVNDFHRSYVGEDDWNKFDVPVAANTAAQTELDLGALYVLEKGEKLEITRIEGMEAAEAVFAHTYRGAYVTTLRSGHSHWSTTMRLVQTTPVFRLTRTWGLDRMDEEGRQILEHAKGFAETRPRERAAGP